MRDPPIPRNLCVKLTVLQLSAVLLAPRHDVRVLSRPYEGSMDDLASGGERDDAAAKMPFSVMFSIVLIGGGAAAAGIVGLLSPKGQRIDAALALVVGAGVGVAGLAIGTWAQGSGSSTEDQQNVLLFASLAGFVAVIGGLLILRRRARMAEPTAAAATEGPGRPDPA